VWPYNLSHPFSRFLIADLITPIRHIVSSSLYSFLSLEDILLNNRIKNPCCTSIFFRSKGIICSSRLRSDIRLENSHGKLVLRTSTCAVLQRREDEASVRQNFDLPTAHSGTRLKSAYQHNQHDSSENNADFYFSLRSRLTRALVTVLPCLRWRAVGHIIIQNK
jgi:hypothetical protein